jgi:Na+/H+ antiporter NhaC
MKSFTGMTIFIIHAWWLAAMVEKKAGGINYLLHQIKDALRAKSAQAGIEHWLVLLLPITLCQLLLGAYCKGD